MVSGATGGEFESTFDVQIMHIFYFIWFMIVIKKFLSFNPIQLWIMPVLKICIESQQRSLLLETMLCYIIACCSDVVLSRKQQRRCQPFLTR